LRVVVIGRVGGARRLFCIASRGEGVEQSTFEAKLGRRAFRQSLSISHKLDMNGPSDRDRDGAAQNSEISTQNGQTRPIFVGGVGTANELGLRNLAEYLAEKRASGFLPVSLTAAAWLGRYDEWHMRKYQCQSGLGARALSGALEASGLSVTKNGKSVKVLTLGPAVAAAPAPAAPARPTTRALLRGPPAAPPRGPVAPSAGAQRTQRARDARQIGSLTARLERTTGNLRDARADNRRLESTLTRVTEQRDKARRDLKNTRRREDRAKQTLASLRDERRTDLEDIASANGASLRETADAAEAAARAVDGVQRELAARPIESSLKTERLEQCLKDVSGPLIMKCRNGRAVADAVRAAAVELAAGVGVSLSNVSPAMNVVIDLLKKLSLEQLGVELQVEGSTIDRETVVATLHEQSQLQRFVIAMKIIQSTTRRGGFGGASLRFDETSTKWRFVKLIHASLGVEDQIFPYDLSHWMMGETAPELASYLFRVTLDVINRQVAIIHHCDPALTITYPHTFTTAGIDNTNKNPAALAQFEGNRIISYELEGIANFVEECVMNRVSVDSCASLVSREALLDVTPADAVLPASQKPIRAYLDETVTDLLAEAMAALAAARPSNPVEWLAAYLALNQVRGGAAVLPGPEAIGRIVAQAESTVQPSPEALARKPMVTVPTRRADLVRYQEIDTACPSSRCLAAAREALRRLVQRRHEAVDARKPSWWPRSASLVTARSIVVGHCSTFDGTLVATKYGKYTWREQLLIGDDEGHIRVVVDPSGAVFVDQKPFVVLHATRCGDHVLCINAANNFRFIGMLLGADKVSKSDKVATHQLLQAISRRLRGGGFRDKFTGALWAQYATSLREVRVTLNRFLTFESYAQMLMTTDDRDRLVLDMVVDAPHRVEIKLHAIDATFPRSHTRSRFRTRPMTWRSRNRPFPQVLKRLATETAAPDSYEALIAAYVDVPLLRDLMFDMGLHAITFLLPTMKRLHEITRDPRKLLAEAKTWRTIRDAVGKAASTPAAYYRDDQMHAATTRLGVLKSTFGLFDKFDADVRRPSVNYESEVRRLRDVMRRIRDRGGEHDDDVVAQFRALLKKSDVSAVNLWDSIKRYDEARRDPSTFLALVENSNQQITPWLDARDLGAYATASSCCRRHAQLERASATDWPQVDFADEDTEHAQALAGEAAGDAQQVFSAARRAAETVETVVGAASLAFNYWHVSRR
jgi:hypothetical protein